MKTICKCWGAGLLFTLTITLSDSFDISDFLTNAHMLMIYILINHNFTINYKNYIWNKVIVITDTLLANKKSCL